MKPKNMMAYRFSRPILLSPDHLSEQLAEYAFAPCSEQDKRKFGWAPVMAKHNNQQLLHVGGEWLLIAARTQEKILPASVIKEEVNERIAAEELKQGRPLKKKEKDTIKEDVVTDLLPRAFKRTCKTYVWICPKKELLFVDASSFKKAEEVLALLRKTIGSLPIVPVTFESSIEHTLTEWLKTSEVPNGFSVLEEAELNSVFEEGGQIRCKRQELTSEEIKTHIEADKMVTKLAINWQDRLDFVLSQDGAISRLKFSDELTEQNDGIAREDVASRFDADMVLFAGEFDAFLPQLFEALGGVAKCQ